jgi:hypothetical protein
MMMHNQVLLAQSSGADEIEDATLTFFNKRSPLK